MRALVADVPDDTRFFDHLWLHSRDRRGTAVARTRLSSRVQIVHHRRSDHAVIHVRADAHHIRAQQQLLPSLFDTSRSLVRDIHSVGIAGKRCVTPHGEGAPQR